MSKITFKEALQETGFSLCNFKSTGYDECECCDKRLRKGTNIYYRRTCWEVDEGQYFCRKCVIDEAEDNRKNIVVDCQECGKKMMGRIGQIDFKCYDCFAFNGGES